MVTKTIDLEASPASLEELLALLESDSEILLIKGDIPLARLSSIEEHPRSDLPRIAGLHAGTTWMSDDFNDPLPDEFWLGD